MAVVRVSDLVKTYRDTEAVRRISFEVEAGEIFGFVGPNGAGKTTTIECMEGLRTPTSGSIEVLGSNPVREGLALRQRIGMQLQEAALPDRLKVAEALDLFGSFYDRRLPADDLLAAVDLGEKRDTWFDKLSGGQKQRLYIALALINDPDVVFLDELTTGLDPQARRSIWGLVEGVRERGKTVVLSTHFMDEAERLCDRVAIIDQGRIVALDTPEKLIAEHGGQGRVIITLGDTVSDDNRTALEDLDGVERVEWTPERATVLIENGSTLVELVRVLVERSFPFTGLRTEQPSLEDVFLALTGRVMDGEGATDSATTTDAKEA